MGESYDLNFGIYEDSSRGVYFMQYIAYFGATVINVVLMLNLLISILGDSYERFQLEQVIVDKEKARISLELQSMMFWSNKQSLLKSIRLCNFAFIGEEEQDWEGRIRFLDKKLDRNFRELIENNRLTETKASEGIKSIETSINKSNTSLECKINDRGTLVESKISDISTSMEGKIASVESKINDISTLVEGKIISVEGKINDISTSLEAKMHDLNQKLEIILNIISK